MNHTIYKTAEKRSHGRLEQRIYYALEVPEDFACKDEWEKLKSVCMALRICKEAGKEETVRARYYISTLPAQAKKLGTAIRGHWGIENSCHWVLDQQFPLWGPRERVFGIASRHLVWLL